MGAPRMQATLVAVPSFGGILQATEPPNATCCDHVVARSIYSDYTLLSAQDNLASQANQWVKIGEGSGAGIHNALFSAIDSFSAKAIGGLSGQAFLLFPGSGQRTRNFPVFGPNV